MSSLGNVTAVLDVVTDGGPDGVANDDRRREEERAGNETRDDDGRDTVREVHGQPEEEGDDGERVQAVTNPLPERGEA